MASGSLCCVLKRLASLPSCYISWKHAYMLSRALAG